MAYFANQKTIIVHRDKVEQNGKRQYLIVYSDRLDQAARTLSSVGLKLYLYLLTNKDGYEKDYSPKHFADVYGVSIESARKAPQNLIDNGYLVIRDGNKLDFYEEPQQTEELEIDIVEEKRYVSCGGVYEELTYKQVYDNLISRNFTENQINKFWNTCKEVK